MDNENTLKLKKAFPRLLRKSAADPAPLQFRGIEAGDGWYDLIYKLLSDIQDKSTVAGINNRKWPRVLQIKEKFGNLRLAINLSAFNDADLELVRNMISTAETKSLEICEDCGAPGTLYKSEWFHVKCPACEDLLQRRKSQNA